MSGLFHMMECGGLFAGQNGPFHIVECEGRA